MQVVDLADAPPVGHPAVGVVVAVGDPAASHAGFWLERASFTLTEQPSDDRRVVTVGSVAEMLERLETRCATWPVAAAVGDDVLRAVDPSAGALAGVVAESLGYSTLQAGREFSDWLTARGARRPQPEPDPVLAERVDDTLHIRFNRPGKHNAFSTAARAALLEALEVARLDPSITEVVLTGAGRSFCSGGDLDEFGTFADPAQAHLARTRYSPALVLDELRGRLGERLCARVHGQVVGSGLEMAAFCGRVVADPQTRLRLPELELGLIPGAGGTVSLTRRIGRWRTAYLFLSGVELDADTACRWGLVDEISAAAPAAR